MSEKVVVLVGGMRINSTEEGWVAAWMERCQQDRAAEEANRTEALVQRLDFWTDYLRANAVELAELLVEFHELHALKKAARIIDLRRLPYKEYLHTNHWLKFRAGVLEAAHNRCQLCNAEGDLHVHHRTYARIGHEKLADCIALCAKCHKLFHEERRLSR